MMARPGRLDNQKLTGLMTGLWYGSLPGLAIPFFLSEPYSRAGPILVLIGGIVGMVIGYRRVRTVKSDKEEAMDVESGSAVYIKAAIGQDVLLSVWSTSSAFASAVLTVEEARTLANGILAEAMEAENHGRQG